MGWKISDLQGAALPLTGNELLEVTQGENSRSVRVMDLLPGFDDTLASDLLNGSDPTKGAAMVARADRHVDSVAALVGLVGRYAGDTVQTTSYHPGWAANLIGPVGGAKFVWDATRPKSQHNGGNIVSPTVPWNGSETTIAAYIAKSGETDPSGLGCWVHRNGDGNEFNALQWGAKNDATLNGANNAVLQPLLDYAEKAVGGGYGGTILFPRGNYGIGVPLNVRDRTTLRGEGTAATVLHFASLTSGHAVTLGPTGPNHPTRGPGQYVFAARLEKLTLAGGNTYKGLDKAMVYTDGAHEHSGLFEVVVRDFVSFGVHYNTGNGGPAFFEISDVEIYGSATLPASGTKRGIYSSAGGAILMVRHATITGGEGGKLAQGIVMTKDNLLATGVHLEECTVGISLSQTDATAPKANTIIGVTGNATVTDLIDISSNFQGSATIHGAVNTSLSTTGLGVIRNRKTNEVFLDQAVASYSYGTNAGPGIAASNGRISVSGGIATVAKAGARAFTVSRTSAGVVRVTLASPMPDTNYTVVPGARPSGGGAMFCEFSPVSATEFDLKTYNQAGTATDPASLWFTLHA